ncbi:PREDICTED: probable serine/threonine-protein kinase MARK-A [Amphimedon queenslandica]|uniref:Activin types I and II receptor domain-containing protein n=1 Tax=Amphimedon queenslandica TaxID=400682 RepID=A0A1X7VNX8_AMPQE|nr:PREDICTED: probable serine/threonine-protein kinase MARK-A [Amphimedon queenslandica]|eukprot:XP_003383393.1 PREDICTED: probable serine/threonine-protein kinase MARK-A [Amphimedon queenslandica]
MIRLVIILASVILSDRIISASDFLTCHCHNTINCFSNNTCHVPLSNGACFVETSRDKGSPLTFGCCINDRILSDCKLYLRRYCESGDYCNQDLQPVSITSGTEDGGSSTTAPTLPPLTLPTESNNNNNNNNNATNSTPQSTTNEQSTDENNNGTEQQDMLYFYLFLLGSIVLLLMIVFVSISIIIVNCKIKELEFRKTTMNEAII